MRAERAAAADRPTAITVPIRLPAAIGRVRRRWDLAARSGAPPHLPFSATADRLELWFQDVTDRWHVGRRFKLG